MEIHNPLEAAVHTSTKVKILDFNVIRAVRLAVLGDFRDSFSGLYDPTYN